MKNKFKRLLALLLVCVMTVPCISALADDNQGAQTGSGATGSSDWGSSGGGLIIGLGRCEYDVYNGPAGDIDALYDWIEAYSQKYYEKVQGSAYYRTCDRSGVSQVTGVNLLGGEDPLGLLATIDQGGSSEYLELSGGAYTVVKEKVPEVMESLKDCNPELYRQYCDNPFGADGHPVVIVVESTTNMSNGVGYTVEGLANLCGTSVYGYSLEGTSGIPCMSWGVSQPQIPSSKTASIIKNSLGVYDYNSDMKGRAFKAAFGLNKRGNIGEEGNGHHGYAGYAADGNGYDITGCYIISCGGIPLDGAEPTINYLHGVYEWDFDSIEIPKNARNHEEDGTAIRDRGSSVNGYFNFGFVDLKNSSAPAWKAYGQVYGSSSVELEYNIYSRGTGNSVDEFTTDRSLLLGQHDGNASGIIQGGPDATYTCTVGWDEFVEALTNGTPEGFDIGGLGNYKPCTINASMKNGMVGVSYVTELFVTPQGGSGPQDGQKIQFVNNQVHTAVYTFQDSERTFHLAQNNLKGYSELKTNGIASAQFEAQAGTPTTEDMFVSMGGSEYVVNMQYALRVDDYDRQYTVTAEPFANYMYYKLGLLESYDQANEFEAMGQPQTWSAGNHTGVSIIPNMTKGNLSWERNSSTLSTKQVTQFKASVDDYLEQVQTLFAELDENAEHSNNYQYNPEEYYDVIVLKGITVTGDGELQNIDTCVKGFNSSKVNATKQALKNFSKQLQALVKFRKGLGSSVNDKHWTRNTVRSYRINTGPILFASTVPGKNDFDSAAEGDVRVEFRWDCDNTIDYQYTESFYGHQYDNNYNFTSHSHGGSDGVSFSGQTDHGQDATCQDGWGSSIDLYESAGSCGHQATPTSASCGASLYKSKSCPGKTVRHLKHAGGTVGLGGQQIPGSYTAVSRHEQVTRQEQWTAIYQGKINIEYSDYNGAPAFTNREGDRGKDLKYDATLHQIYKSVKYMDIIEAHVWRLAGGAVEELADDRLMVEETAASVITPIIELACMSKGFTLYNTSPVNVKGFWADNIKSPDGTTYDKVWTAVDESFMETITLNPEDDEPENPTANNELEAIGRLANSFNPDSTEENQFFSSPFANHEQALKCETKGDSLMFTYNTEEQGGWSHWSFDGLLKQAIAMTFYGSEEAVDAHRNYILVQSDFLSVGDSGLTMAGMQWQTKDWYEEGNTYGLTQCILNSGIYEDAADIANYYPTGEPWRHYGFDEDPVANTTQEHTAGMDVSEGTGGEEVGLGKSKPSDKTLQLGEYAEGPEDWDVYEEYRDGEHSYVRLDQQPTYKSWNKATITGSQSSGGTEGVWANFASEGKGSSPSHYNFDGNCLPTVGYVGAQDSVYEDGDDPVHGQHIPEPSGGGSTQFKPTETFVTGGFGSLDFTKYGSTVNTGRLVTLEQTASSGAGSKVISVPGASQKNRVVNRGLYYPYVQGLNVIRWLPNGSYAGGETALYYDECLSLMESMPGVTSIVDQTLSQLRLQGGLSQYEQYCVADLHSNATFDMILNGEVIGVGGSGGFLTGVSYGGPTRTSPGKTNSVTIYNPSPAQNVAILPMSDELPDGVNNFKDKDDRDNGYAVRDQRVSEDIVQSTEGESYISYVKLTASDVVNTEKVYRYTLKPKSEYNGGVTEYYDVNKGDYINIQAQKKNWELSPGGEGFIAPSTGTYTMTLFATNDSDEVTVDLKLEAGDVITLDNTAVYLDRNSDSDILVSYDDLANSVAEYYLMKDNMVSSGQAVLQQSQITNFVEQNRKLLSSLAIKIRNINYTYNPPSSEVSFASKVSDAVVAYNAAVTAYNTSVREKFWGAVSNDTTITANPVFYNTVAYHDYLQILAEINNVRGKLDALVVDAGLTAEYVNVLQVTSSSYPGKIPDNMLLAQHEPTGYYVAVDASNNILLNSGVATFYLPGNFTTPVYAKKDTDDKWYQCTAAGVFGNPKVLLNNPNPTWFDQNAYAKRINDESTFITVAFTSSHLRTILSEVNSKIGQASVSSGSITVDYVPFLSAAVKDFNAFTTMVKDSFGASGDTITLNYPNSVPELKEFLLQLNTARDMLTNAASRNGLTVELVKVPTVEIVGREGLAQTFKKSDRFDVEQGATMAMNLAGLGMQKGSTLVVRIPYDKAYSDPAEVKLTCSGDMLDFKSVANGVPNNTDYDYTLYKYSEPSETGVDWVYVIEAFNDISLGELRFVFNQNASIMKRAGTLVEFDKIYLFDVAANGGKNVYLGTTIEHNHYESGSIYWSKSNRIRTINKSLFTATSQAVTTGGKNTTLYITEQTGTTWQLNQEAADNPHKVWNANWRYYVVGWKTSTGSFITSPSDPRLYVDETILYWPKGTGTVTVKELRTQSCLVMFGGNVYVTLRDAAVEHKILETGIKVNGHFDWWSLGLSTSGHTLPEYKLVSTEDILIPNQPGMGLGGSTDHQLAYQDGKWEFCFYLLDEDAPLFNVEYATNPEYRFNQTDLRQTYTEEGNWALDWERTEVEQSGSVIVAPGRQPSAASAEYISLDDEFSIYFDNVGAFPGNPDSKNASVQSTSALGYGWNANGIKLLQSDEVSGGISDWFGSDDVGSRKYVVDGVEKDEPVTECTGWIYAKYVTFNIDVYVFKDDSGNVNPTCNAYDINGNLRDHVLVKAGTPVYLGYYAAGGNNFAEPTKSYQADWFNAGGFHDYGAPEFTRDKYGDAFTYHFWCPLYNGERDRSVEVKFHSVNINDRSASSNPSGNNNIGTTTGKTREVTNNQPETTDDATRAHNNRMTSIVGRIGALTIADTGDPRYSDSFKITDLTNDDISAFLIYPIVRKITQYANTPNTIGSQRGIVLDPFDVRGRICNEWLLDAVKRLHADSDDWRNVDYKFYSNKSYNTYSTQWFKQSLTRYSRGMSEDGSTTFALQLPLTPDFNKHDAFKNKPMRVGYEVYCSLESIGNYFGDSTTATDSEEDISNANNDYGQKKVQIRPFYAAYDASSETVSNWDGPVDVYMRSGDTYVLINSGCDKNTSTETGCACTDSAHSIAGVLSVMYNNYAPSYIETNTGDTVLDLDESMKRRLVTEVEAGVTNDVTLLDPRTTMLHKVLESTGGIGGESLDVKYTYGCSQMLFLRSRNMTFVGGKTAALNWNNTVEEVDSILNKKYAQKWYFGLGLPSSAVFVPHGQKLTDKTVLKTGYVINSVDVVASGEVWTLHYMSEVSKMAFEFEDYYIPWEKWNPWSEKYPWLIPVTYYNIGDTSTADLDTQGSH